MVIVLVFTGNSRYPLLSPCVPVHFNTQGVANEWMVKSVAVIFVPVSITVGSILLHT
ncbi:MAG TPA: hypothetical protein DD856_01840 [Sulfobacillus sp.]|nr:hypothetical protein [Sulfobacillus sp.]